MAILRSPSGLLLPMASRAGLPLLTSPSNMAAPVIVRPSSEFAFDMTTTKPGVPGNNDQFENFGTDRDWASNFNHPTEGFAGIRWQPTWAVAYGYYGSWEPAQADVYRVQRKGTSGQDAQTLVFTCGPNTAPIPAGDKVVIWTESTFETSVDKSNFNLSGYSLPTRTKMTVLSCTPSAPYDSNGRRIIEVDAGTPLPAIDYSPQFQSGQSYQRSRMLLRHWSFYSDASTKRMRHPIGWFCDIAKNNVVANGGHIMVGGMQWIPTWYDWTADWNYFGSLTEELWRMECQGLADYLGDTDPRKLAIELENEPNSEYFSKNGQVGYGQLLRDVWYPVARQVWGANRTLVVKAAQFGSMDSLLNDFDFVCPAGDNAHLAFHNYDGQITWPNGKINFGGIDQTDWMADQLKAKVTQLGYRGGGMTEMGAAGWEFYDYGQVVSLEERGRRHGRALTSLTRNGMHFWAWGATGDHYRCVGIETLNGKRIEAYYREMAPFTRRAGLQIS